MIPLVGTASKGLNAAWYASQGQYGNAALSAVYAIPEAGDIPDAAKLGKDVTGLLKLA